MTNLKAKWLTLALTVLICLPLIASATTESGRDDRYLARYIALYGYTLPDPIARQIEVNFMPQEADCGPVQVKFDEMLYDGQWMYTAASVWPKDPDEVLVLPGDAQSNDRAAGFYGENARDDERSFEQIAREESKRLIAVYAYIKEFDATGAYFIDHFQETKDVSVLMSGAQLACGNKPVAITWSIQVYEVDLKMSKYVFQNEYLFPMTVEPLQPYIEQTYHVVNGANAPFDKVVLAHTPLSTYVLPQWNNPQDQNRYSAALVEADEQAVSQGVPIAMGAYALAALPKQIALTIANRETGDAVSQLTLAADDGISTVK